MDHVSIEDESTVVRVGTGAFGLETVPVTVECAYGRGFAGIQILGGEQVDDSKERARAAVEACGITIPAKKIVVSLSPGDAAIGGSHLDLPLAVSLAVLIDGRLPCKDLSRWLFGAELGIDGRLKPCRGSVALAALAAEHHFEGIIGAVANLPELAKVAQLCGRVGKPLQVYAFDSMPKVLEFLFDNRYEQIRSGSDAEIQTPALFDDLVLTPELQLVCETAAAGMHSMLLWGPPGTGKSALASRMACLLPTPQDTDLVHLLKIYSQIYDRLPEPLLQGQAPCRAPHHFSSVAALLGSDNQPGEMALAHGGVLFLDELPEFRRDAIESLREPLETGHVHVARAHGARTWFSRFILIGAANCCPCGWSNSRRRRCDCPPQKLKAYRQKISGPLQERVDIHLNMPELSSQHFMSTASSLGITALMRERVHNARAFGRERNRSIGCVVNADIPTNKLAIACGIGNLEDLLTLSMQTSILSGRALTRLLRLARTLADLESCEVVSRKHVEHAYEWQAVQAARRRGDVL